MVAAGPRRAARPAQALVFIDDRLGRAARQGEPVRAPTPGRPRGDPGSSTTRSTSSTPPAPPASPRARRSRTTTSSTTATSSAGAAASPSRTASAFRCRSITVSAWSWATWPAPRHGACMVDPGEAFDPPAVLETVQAERCTSLYGVPTMFIAELGPSATSPTSTARRCAPASWPGSPCPIELMKQVVDADAHAAGRHRLRHDRDLADLHAEPRSTIRWSGASARSAGCMPHVEIKRASIRRRAHACRAARRASSARAATASCAATGTTRRRRRAAIDAAGWMHSGDLAVMDDDGYVHIVGRLKDMIIRGGENISPREIEEFLHTHPAVSEAQVIGVPEREVRRGSHGLGAPARRGPTPRTRAMRAFCRGRIAHVQDPALLAVRRRASR